MNSSVLNQKIFARKSSSKPRKNDSKSENTVYPYLVLATTVQYRPYSLPYIMKASIPVTVIS
jgi:hypothetical protein